MSKKRSRNPRLEVRAVFFNPKIVSPNEKGSTNEYLNAKKCRFKVQNQK